MKLRALFRALRLRGWTIALITLAALGASLVYTLQQAPLYASTVRIFVTPDASLGKDDAASTAGNKQAIESYAALMEGDTIARRVIKQLNLNDSPSKLAERISTSVEKDTFIVRLVVTEPSANRAQQVADAVAEEFIVFLGELQASDESSSATARVIDAADRAERPSSPNLPLNLGIGFGVGLLLGALWALLRERADTTVRTASVLEDATGAPVLGAILFDEDAIEEPTIRELDHYDPRVEGYRVVRTSLQFLDPDHQADGTSKVYVVSSAVPGEGKTTTAINLGLILAEGGEKVALIEADLRRPTFSDYLKLDPERGLTTTLIRRTTLAEATQEVGALDVLTSGKRPPNPAELVKSDAMRDLIAQLRATYDYVLIDAPPLLPVTDASLLAAVSDGVILVTRYGDTTTAELTTAVNRVKSVSGTIVGSILNLAPANDADGHGYGYGYAPENHDPETYYRTHSEQAPSVQAPSVQAQSVPVQEAVAAVAAVAAAEEAASAETSVEASVETPATTVPALPVPALPKVVLPVPVVEEELAPNPEPVVEEAPEPDPVVEVESEPVPEPVEVKEPELASFFERIQSAVAEVLDAEPAPAPEPEPEIEEPEPEVEAEPEPDPEVDPEPDPVVEVAAPAALETSPDSEQADDVPEADETDLVEAAEPEHEPVDEPVAPPRNPFPTSTRVWTAADLVAEEDERAQLHDQQPAGADLPPEPESEPDSGSALETTPESEQADDDVIDADESDLVAEAEPLAEPEPVSDDGRRFERALLDALADAIDQADPNSGPGAEPDPKTRP